MIESELRKLLDEANKQGVTCPNMSGGIDEGAEYLKTYGMGRVIVTNKITGGAEKFGGKITVMDGMDPLWIMVYFGSLAAGANPEQVFTFLQEALGSGEGSVRGSNSFDKQGMHYSNNTVDMGPRGFRGLEAVVDRTVVYELGYIGGSLVPPNK